MSDCFTDGRSWPPGFRFHPTDEELVLYYLKRKICHRRLKLDIIGETDVYKWDPEDLPAQSMVKNGDRQWFFFSPRDRKYPNGARSNRATGNGYWKATGKDRSINYNGRSVGTKKTLVFYRGRAPTGQRTDWVMHEYTVDDEELKRSPTPQDYYALYKAYKKSGPGPKNGEQYGAPFNEENWADEENSNAISFALSRVKSSHDVACVDNNIKILPPSDDRHTNVYAVAAPREIETQNSGSTTGEAIVAKPIMVLQPCSQQEAREETSTPNISENELDNTKEDFLEIDDLFGLDFTLPDVDRPVETLQFEEIGENGMSQFDLFHDAEMFIREMGPVDHELFADPFFKINMNDMVNQFDYPPRHLNEAGSHIWTNEPSGITSAQSNEDVNSLATSGLICEGTSKTSTERDEDQARRETVSGSWFTSALWGSLDSIPTRPASASESTFSNITLERLSSFGRIRAKAIKSEGTIAIKGSGLKGRGFFYFSVLGALCAVLWVLLTGCVMSCILG